MSSPVTPMTPITPPPRRQRSLPVEIHLPLHSSLPPQQTISHDTTWEIAAFLIEKLRAGTRSNMTEYAL